MLLSVLILLLLLPEVAEGGKWWRLWGREKEPDANAGGRCLYAVILAEVPSDDDLRFLAPKAAFFAAAVALAEPQCDAAALVARHVLEVPAIADSLKEGGLAARAIDLPVPLRDVAGQDLQRSVLAGRGWDLLRLAPLSPLPPPPIPTGDASTIAGQNGYDCYDRIVMCGNSLDSAPVAAVDASLLPEGDWKIALPASAPSGPVMVIRPAAAAAAAVTAALSPPDAAPWLFIGIGPSNKSKMKTRDKYAAALKAPAFENAVAAAKIATGELGIARCGSTISGWCTKEKARAKEGSQQQVLATIDSVDICQEASALEGREPDETAALLAEENEVTASVLRRFGEVLKSEFVTEACRMVGERERNAELAAEAAVPPPPPSLARQPQPADKIVLTAREVKALQYFMLVNEKEKILMLAIPKVGCTQVNQLFLRMHGSKGWNAALTYQVHAHKDRRRFFASTMSPQRLSEIFNDPSWTRAVFLRDPAARLLSAYLDKFVFKMSYGTKLFKKPVSLGQLVDLLQPEAARKHRGEYPGPMLGLTPYTNPHWRAQTAFFAGGGDGGSRLLPYFNFVGRIEHAESHARELLQAAGLWERFGASGWGSDGTSAFFAGTTGSSHATAASQKETMYFDEALLAQLRRAYKQDYALLDHFFPP